MERNGGCTSSMLSYLRRLPIRHACFLSPLVLCYSATDAIMLAQWQQHLGRNGTPDLAYIWLEPFTDKIWDTLLCISNRGTLFRHHDPLKHELFTISKELHLLYQLHYQVHIQKD
jgi:hypothetical protein